MILLLAVLIITLFPQTALTQEFSMRVVDVAVPDRVLVGRSLTLTVSVQWSGLDRLRSAYGPPYSVRVKVCEGSSSEYTTCGALGYGPSKSGETVDPSGSKKYRIELTAPERPRVWHLTSFFAILNREEGWILFTDMPSMWREFDVKVTDKVTLTVQTQPGKPGVAVSFDGTSMNTDATGSVQLEVSITGSHTVQVPSEISTGTGMKMVFVKWTDGQTSNSRTITLTDDTTLTAKYKTQYLFTVNSAMGSPQGSGWYDEGSSAQFSVTSPLTVEDFMGMLGGKYVFQHWSGDSTATTPTASVTMDGPKTVSAEWRTDNTMPYIIIGAIGAIVIVIAALVLLMRRRKAPAPAPAYQPPPPVTVARPPPQPPVAPAPAVKFCINCGAPLPVQVQFCNKCGSKQ